MPAYIILSPSPFVRFRATAIAVARLVASDGDGLVLLSQADRPIPRQDSRAFARAMAAAAESAAQKGRVIRFACPAKGDGGMDAHDAGWLLAPAAVLATVFERAVEGAWPAAQAAVANEQPDLDCLRLAAHDYDQLPSAAEERLLAQDDAIPETQAPHSSQKQAVG